MDQNKQKVLVPRTNNKRVAGQPFNPPQIPLYLGIFPLNEKKAKQSIQEYTINNLEILQNSFPEDVISSINIQNLLKEKFKYPQSHHITTFFIKGNPKGQPYFDNFEQNIEIPIQVLAFIYVPNKIICGVCLPDPNMIDIQNKVPHLTMYIGEWQAKYSNDVLEALLNIQSNPIDEQFLLNEENKLIKKFEKVNVNGENCDVYFVKDKILTIDAQTAAFNRKK